MQESFAEAFINAEHRVLGRKLQPFCLRHCLYLEAIGSPFVDVINGKQVPIKREDLELAVLICSSKGSEILNAIARANSISALTMRFRRFKPNLTKFLSYLADYVTAPSVWEKPQKGVKSTKINAPWILTRVLFFIAKTSVTLEEAWTMPLGELMWYAGAYAEQEGGAKLVSAEEQKAIETMRRMQKKWQVRAY